MALQSEPLRQRRRRQVVRVLAHTEGGSRPSTAARSAIPQCVAVLCGRDELANSTSSYSSGQMLDATGSSDRYARCHAVPNRSA